MAVVEQYEEQYDDRGGLTAPLVAGGLPVDHPSRLFQPGGAAPAVVGGADPDVMYVAFFGRVSGDELQDPTISLPRQLAACRRGLPANAVIVAFFWDVESSRKDLGERGHGSHEKFDLAIPRDGGLPELLEEARRKDRRFDAVVCESADRVARLMHQATVIEHELDRLGVSILAADEGIPMGGKKSTRVLIRRQKQVIAEWYISNLLEMARDAYCEHTRQGWNIGVPPYGYLGERVPHPNPVKRDQGMHKTRLVPDPEKARAVLAVFQWRVGERLSYGDIAERLNERLDLYPPKKSNRPDLQRTSWSKSSVRELLENPKYTGYMVWNRRASKTGSGRVNHPREWVWSPRPTHEPLVTMELFKAARAVAPTKERSRSSHGINRHPLARRTYLLRSFVVCSYCDHRMHGKFRRRGGTYFACEPKLNHGSEAALRFPGHPKGVWVREDALTEGVLRFFAERVYGPQRRELLAAEFEQAGTSGRKSAVKEIEALKKSIADLDRRRTRLIEQLESLDDADGSFLRDVQGRHKKLTAERDDKLNRLAELAEAVPGAAPAADLIDRVLMADVERLRLAPEAAVRQVFDAFRLRVVYDGRTGTANCRVTITDESLATIDTATRAALAAAGWGSGGEPAADDLAGSDGTTADPGDHGERRADARGECFRSELRPRQDAKQMGTHRTCRRGSPDRRVDCRASHLMPATPSQPSRDPASPATEDRWMEPADGLPFVRQPVRCVHPAVLDPRVSNRVAVVRRDTQVGFGQRGVESEFRSGDACGHVHPCRENLIASGHEAKSRAEGGVVQIARLVAMLVVNGYAEDIPGDLPDDDPRRTVSVSPGLAPRHRLVGFLRVRHWTVRASQPGPTRFGLSLVLLA